MDFKVGGKGVLHGVHALDPLLLGELREEIDATLRQTWCDKRSKPEMKDVLFHDLQKLHEDLKFVSRYTDIRN